MISFVELKYVQNFARFAPFPGEEYANNVMEKLVIAHDIFKNKYEGKQYSLILSNGEEFHFEVKSKNLAHLLGIDLKNLTSSEMTEARKVLGYSSTEFPFSYDLLKRIIDNADKVIKNDKECSREKRILNYYKMMIKCTSFSKLSSFENFNYGFINFNKDLYNVQVSEQYTGNSEKFIFTPNDEALIPYCMMGFLPDNGSNIYVPETLLAPTDFYKYIENQELLLPVQTLVNNDDILSKIVATNSDKARILEMYKSILLECNIKANINIFNDYQNMLYSLKEEEKNLEKKLV